VNVASSLNPWLRTLIRSQLLSRGARELARLLVAADVIVHDDDEEEW